MTRVRVRGFQIFEDRHGTWRCYHRATRIKIDLGATPLGSAGFFAECSKIQAVAKAQAATKPRPGTLGGLIEFYRRTDHYRDLSDRTKADYQRCADFLAPIADMPVFKINTPMVAGIHDKAAAKLGWRRGNYVLTLLSEVFRQSVPRGHISENFAAKVLAKRRPKSLAKVNRPWTAAELETVLGAAEPHVKAAIALMANTGLDPSDAIRLKKDQIVSDVIRGLRGKTQAIVAVPIGRSLRAALDSAPAHDAETIVATSRGKPWTYSGLSSVWHRFKGRLEEANAIAPGLTLKGLRHTVATTLREAGMSDRDIADLLGQKTASMALHYSSTADLEAKNRKTVRKLDSENERRRRVVKPSAETVKPEED